ncbi:hypothetical protein [Herbaspirillum seropedicae]|uniref:hypothetical protein n=1 Tax=Herbaspirillum seropedicae TaxID=964 RepID=UPI003D9647A2
MSLRLKKSLQTVAASDRSLRMWQLDHFPYLLFYRTQAETLSLLRVLHERRALSANALKH